MGTISAFLKLALVLAIHGITMSTYLAAEIAKLRDRLKYDVSIER